MNGAAKRGGSIAESLDICGHSVDLLEWPIFPTRKGSVEDAVHQIAERLKDM